MQRLNPRLFWIAPVVLGLFFVVNVITLFNSLPTPTSSNVGGHVRISPNIPGQSRIDSTSQKFNVDAEIYLNDDDDQYSVQCYEYGCHEYPPQLDSQLRHLLSQTFVDVKNNNVKDKTFPFGTSNMAMLSQIGKSHSENQDRAVLIEPFGKNLPLNAEETFLLGIFDGHGVQGQVIADYIARELPGRLWEKLQPLMDSNKDMVSSELDEKITQALKTTFVDVDHLAPPNALKGGSTASVTLRFGHKLYIANTGDSQTVIVTVGNNNRSGELETSVEFMTRLDKAKIPEEKSRIEGLGGTVRINPQNNVARVIVYSVTSREAIALAMSRSIGDWEWKPIGVIAEPIVNVIDISTLQNAFIIAASDGLWDTRRQKFFANQFAEPFYGATQSNVNVNADIHPLHRLWEVIEKITPKTGYQDDITAIIKKLEATATS